MPEGVDSVWEVAHDSWVGMMCSRGGEHLVHGPNKARKIMSSSPAKVLEVS